MPVTRSFSQAVQFGAAHTLKDHPTCSRDHGHSYTVTLTWVGDPIPDNWGYPMTVDQLEDAVSVVVELRGLRLNDMLPASPPSVAGVAAYLLDRTRMLGVTKVEVHESDTNVTGAAEHLDR